MAYNNNRAPREEAQSEYLEKVVSLNRVSKTVKGGRVMKFAALCVVGDGKGKVGCGHGKASEVSEAIISVADRAQVDANTWHFPLTAAMKAELERNPHVEAIEIEPETRGGDVYPLGHNNWTRDNFGPIYIPRKGDRILITNDNY